VNCRKTGRRAMDDGAVARSDGPIPRIGWWSMIFIHGGFSFSVLFFFACLPRRSEPRRRCLLRLLKTWGDSDFFSCCRLCLGAFWWHEFGWEARWAHVAGFGVMKESSLHGRGCIAVFRSRREGSGQGGEIPPNMSSLLGAFGVSGSGYHEIGRLAPLYGIGIGCSKGSG